MPNWTSNTLKAPVEVLKKYIRKDEDGSDVFDFNLVIPRPEIYADPDLESGGHENIAIYWYRSERGTKTPEEIGNYKKCGSIFERVLFDKLNMCSIPTVKAENLILGRFGKTPDELYEIGRKYMQAYEQYGYLDWYDWSNANWGTKWNACDSDCSNVDEGLVAFDTAWCMPKPVIEKIFADNPDSEIVFIWRDEDYDGTHTLCRNVDGEMIFDTEWEDEYMYDEDEDGSDD